MKHTFFRVLALIMTLALVLVLPACGKKDEEAGGGQTDTLTDVSPADDPAGYLASASAASMEELATRYSGSPLAALSGLTGRSGSLELDVSVTEDGETSELGGALSFDLDAGKLLLNAYIAYMGQQLDAGLYLDKDYLGVSVPALFGDGAYYGFATHDLYGQISQSALGQYMAEEDLEAFRTVDNILSAIGNMDTSFMNDYAEEMKSIADSFTASAELEARQEKITVNSVISDGWIIHASLDSGDLADLYSRVADAMYNSSLWTSLSDIVQAAGEDPSELGLDDARAQLDEVIADLRASDLTLDCEYSVTDGKLIRLHIVPSGEDIQEPMEMYVDLYEGGVITVSVSSGDSTVLMTSKASSEKGSYSHVITIESEGEAMTLSTDWSENRLNVSLGSGGVELASLTGEFGVSDTGFYLSDGLFTVSDPDADAVTVPISLKYTSGATVTTPTELNNIFELSESDLAGLILGASSMMGSM